MSASVSELKHIWYAMHVTILVDACGKNEHDVCAGSGSLSTRDMVACAELLHDVRFRRALSKRCVARRAVATVPPIFDRS